MRKRRNLIIAAIVVIVIIVLIIILIPKQKQNQNVTSTVTTGSISVNVTASGSVEVGNLQNAGFKVPGNIAKIYVKPGDTVSVGQNMAELDPTTYSNQLSQSQEALRQAQNNLASAKLLGTYKSNYDLDNYQIQIDNAQAKVNSDLTSLDETHLYSQINGIVAAVNNSVGDSVQGSGSNSSSTGAGVIIVIDPTSYYVKLTVGETDISKIKQGELVQLTFDALGTKTYTGTVDSFDLIPSVSSNVVSFNVKVKFTKPDADIRPKLTANAVIIAQQKDNVLLVPNSAIKTLNGQKYVNLLTDPNNPNSTQQQNVTTGLVGDTDTEITDGLKDGDVIVVSTGSTTSTNQNGFGGFGGLGGAFGGGQVVRFNGGGVTSGKGG